MSDKFAEIRSLLNTTEWDGQLFDGLKQVCISARRENPIKWMTQTIPYIASFQEKWDKNPIYVYGQDGLEEWLSITPCAWFKLSSKDITKDHPGYVRVISLEQQSLMFSHSSPSLEFLKFFPNMQKLTCTNLSFHTEFKLRLGDLKPEDIPPIVHLDLSGNHLRDSDYMPMHDIGLLKHVTSLKICYNTDITKVPFGILPKLVDIDVSETSVPDDFPIPGHFRTVIR